MKNRIRAAAGTLLGFLPTAVAAEPNVITQPDWISTPSGEEFGRAYPTLAMAFEIGGKAIISCKVAASGRLQDCKVVGETPIGLGFGAAAVSMAPAFHIRPKSVDGKFVEGGEVRIPLRFVPQRQAEPPPSPPPSSSRALEQARKVVDITTDDDVAGAQIENLANRLESGIAAIPAFAQVAAALRASYPPRAAQARATSAALLADAFTEKELGAIAAYFSSAAGSAQIKSVGEHGNPKRADSLAGIAFARAREFFCENADCIKPGVEAFPATATDDVSLVTAPIWSQQPSDEMIDRFLPSIAQSLQIAGAVRLFCVVGPLGVMTDCTLADERPRGLGFARAGKSLAQYYRISPSQLLDGAAGRRFAIDIRFEAGPIKPINPLSQIEARSPRALSLARKLFVAQDIDRGLQFGLNGLLEDQRKAAIAEGLTTAEFDKVMSTFARGVQAAFEQSLESNAAILTKLMSDEQLVAAISFWNGPVGTAWKEKSPGVLAQTAALGASYGRLVAGDAGRAFCKLNDCEGVSLKIEVQAGPDQNPTSATPAASTRNP